MEIFWREGVVETVLCRKIYHYYLITMYLMYNLNIIIFILFALLDKPVRTHAKVKLR